jgi:myo-inositol-1(or 4)-monophosphatase
VPTTDASISERLRFARTLAREAGALALRYFRRDLDFIAVAKGPQDWVSAADRDVESLIRDRLASAFPGDAMLGEEAGGTLGESLWVVDPIDGTLNFVHGVRYWCISLAFVQSGERLIGVIYDPCLDELFWGARGQGAWCNDQPIRSSSCTRLDEALLCIGYVPRHSLSRHLAIKRLLHEAGAAVKDMGAGALMLAHVAAGRFDAFAEPHMHPWDALAGLLLIEEAGGRVHDYPASTHLTEGGRVTASAAGIYDALEALIARA